MALSSLINRVSYTGNGATTNFSFGYYFQSTSDLIVKKVLISTGVETLQVLNTDYTISGTATNGVYASGATVVMGTAPSSLYKLVIYRDPALTQGLDLVENDSMPAESIEQAFDKRAMVEQRLDERLDRALRLPDGFTETLDMELPAVTVTRGYLRLNADEDGWEYAEISTEAISDHIADTTDAHDASAISNTAVGNISGTDVQSVLTALAPVLISTFATPTDIVAAASIAISSGKQKTKKYIQGSGGAVSAGNIDAGTFDGQELLLVGCSDTNTVTLDTGGRIITKGTAILAANDIIAFTWDHGSTKWVEMFRNT